jgi:peptidoglycan/xylan/chitin deacetylase (PgdA/CDA1 family)
VSADYVGYGNRLPALSWPDGRTVAVSVVLNYEEGAEQSFAFGDAAGQTLGEWSGFSAGDPGVRNRSIESFWEYGSRVGVWRLLDVLDRQGVPATVFACALALERNPLVARAMVERGHEIANHGYRWEEHFHLSRAEEDERIRLALDSFQATAGVRPVGAFLNNGVTDHTRELLIEHGFIYDSNSYAEDLPYYVRVGERDHLVIPYASDLNDIRFWTVPGFVTGEHYESYLRATLDQLLDEAGPSPRLMSVGLHMRISGRPARARAVERFIAYARMRGAWIARRDEIARWWLDYVRPSA